MRLILLIYFSFLFISDIRGQLIGVVNDQGVIDTLLTYWPYLFCKGRCYQFVTIHPGDNPLIDSFYHEYRWKFPGGSPAFSTERDPYVCFLDVPVGPADSFYLLQKTRTYEGNVGWIGQLSDIGAIAHDCAPDSRFTVDRTTICQGDFVQFSDSTLSLPHIWYWNFEGGTPSAWYDSMPPPVRYEQSGDYKVTLITSNVSGVDTLIKEQYIHVLPGNLPNAQFRSVYSGFAGESATLAACMEGERYRWWPPEGLSCTDCEAPEVVLGYHKDYYCIVSDKLNQCTDTCHISMQVSARQERIFFPNAFSPNHDGVNDIFSGSFWLAQPQSLRIYNRWGSCVYSSRTDFEWDGTYRGEMMDTGVFLYVITYVSQFDAEVKTQTGSVTLIR